MTWIYCWCSSIWPLLVSFPAPLRSVDFTHCTGVPYSFFEEWIGRQLPPGLYAHRLTVILRTLLSLNNTPERTAMAFRDALSANEHLCKVLAEAGIPNLEGQVDVNVTDRKGWGSFGDVYMGKYNGTVSCPTCLSTPITELIPKFTSTEGLCEDLERNSLNQTS